VLFTQRDEEPTLKSFLHWEMTPYPIRRAEPLFTGPTASVTGVYPNHTPSAVRYRSGMGEQRPGFAWHGLFLRFSDRGKYADQLNVLFNTTIAAMHYDAGPANICAGLNISRIEHTPTI
jgi:hypothetical protein